jgi:hypothetical protein
MPARRGSVRIVPVHGYPINQLVLAWLPVARPTAARLTATARAVLARSTPAWASAGPA